MTEGLAMCEHVTGRVKIDKQKQATRTYILKYTINKKSECR